MRALARPLSPPSCAEVTDAFRQTRLAELKLLLTEQIEGVQGGGNRRKSVCRLMLDSSAEIWAWGSADTETTDMDKQKGTVTQSYRCFRNNDRGIKLIHTWNLTLPDICFLYLKMFHMYEIIQHACFRCNLITNGDLLWNFPLMCLTSTYSFVFHITWKKMLKLIVIKY